MKEETNTKENVQGTSTTLKSFLKDPDYIKALNLTAECEKIWDAYAKLRKDNEYNGTDK